MKFQSVENPRMRTSVGLDDSGQFDVSSAPTGIVKISVMTTPELYPEMTLIPKKYSRLKASALQRTISDDDEPFEIKLKSK